MSAEMGRCGTARPVDAPVSVVPYLDVGEAGAHRPLEISRATAVDHAGAEGREIPTVPQRIIVADPPRDGQIEDMS